MLKSFLERHFKQSHAFKIKSFIPISFDNSTGTYIPHERSMQSHYLEPWDQQTDDPSIKHQPSPRHVNKNFERQESFLGITVL